MLYFTPWEAIFFKVISEPGFAVQYFSIWKLGSKSLHKFFTAANLKPSSMFNHFWAKPLFCKREKSVPQTSSQEYHQPKSFGLWYIRWWEEMINIPTDTLPPASGVGHYHPSPLPGVLLHCNQWTWIQHGYNTSNINGHGYTIGYNTSNINGHGYSMDTTPVGYMDTTWIQHQ